MVNFGKPDGIDCGPGAWRAAVCVWASRTVWFVRLLVCDSVRVVFHHRCQAADGWQSSRDREIHLFRDSLHSRAQKHPRRHLAGSFCGAVRWGNGVASRVRTRHPAHRAVGLGAATPGARVGALSTAVFLAHHPIRRRAGHRMFAAVIVFGVATVAFALSRNVWVSMAILCMLGAADVTSVVVRSSLVQLETPDEMRGRVSARQFAVHRDIQSAWASSNRG